ncbi:prosalusin isoform X1 [Polypterus senegalus]|uniref:prosalusin isoform X1 n=1 Tax=Polypterus senegalus TaxID=55291 RepID=UPI0019654DEA|nr:prosalusin isoform X1 [Polypterus senegalus]
MEFVVVWMATFLGFCVVFLAYFTVAVSAFRFKDIYCKISDYCECDFQPDIKAGLEWDLYRNLYGQHLAQEIVSEALDKFLHNDSPERPLVFSFHGSSGTGKTMVSSLVGKYLFGSSLSSRSIHHFIPTLHFPDSGQIEQYKKELKSWVEGNLTVCARSLFVFDEMDTMPSGLVDVLAPLLGPYHLVYQTNYRKAIYIFISTSGSEIINRATLEARKSGLDREEIRIEDLENLLSQAAYDCKGGLCHSEVIRTKLISHFVPFMPLTRRHVERCVRQEICHHGQCHRKDIITMVAKSLGYHPESEMLFSHTGCKTVSAKVDYYL